MGSASGRQEIVEEDHVEPTSLPDALPADKIAALNPKPYRYWPLRVQGLGNWSEAYQEPKTQAACASTLMPLSQQSLRFPETPMSLH